MERMQISVVSVVERDGVVVARARANAAQARIWIEVCFKAEPVGADLWLQARDNVLRYLDPA